MGKKVFEVAKELGVDHRELLKRCDSMGIEVRNYLSVLTDADEARLRGSVDSKRSVVEKVQAPGVVRRRRKKITPGSGPKPPALQPTPLKATATPPAEPTPEPDAPVVEAPAAEPASVENEVAPKAAEVEAETAAPADEVNAATEEGPAPAADEASSDAAATPEPAPEPAAEEKPAPVAPVSKIRKPTGSGGAKVLGSIPLDQLQQRTARPQRPQRPASRGPVARTGGPAGAGGRPQSARPWDSNQAGNMPPMPPSQDTRRRKASGGRGSEEERDQPRRTSTRRRQEYSREDIYQGSARNARGRKRKSSAKKGLKTQITTPAAHKRVVRVDETISVGELAKALSVKSNEIIAKLMAMGTMATLNEQLDIDTATLLASEYNYEVKNVAFDEEEILSGPATEEALEADPEALPRAPVVTVMGHVDHGKTTLLDRIRAANVAEGEAGGITQHIAAYKVPVGDKEVTFLDTPGHAAFASMRARGASVTDIVVLIVAADDGVMPQTEESINHAKAAGVPIVVAINKCDKPGVDPERIKQEMTQFELVPEEWGGDTMFLPISALNGEGIDELLEALALQAEVLELVANPKNSAYGRVVEARMDKGRGVVCTALIQEGTLKKGDYVVAGNSYGRVRTMLSDTGSTLTEAGPSTPVELLGFNALPSAGDAFHIVKNERDAKKVIANRADKARAAANQPKSMDPMAMLAAFGQAEAEKKNIILKADVSGSYEAIKLALEQVATDEVEVRLLHGGVGPVIQSDVDLAVASDATIIAFNVPTDGKAKRTADREDVQISTYSIIYELIDGVKDILSGMLAPEIVEEYLGRAEVRAVFHIQRVGPVAGCAVTDGKVARGSKAKVMRDGEEFVVGNLSTLKRFKDDVREVASGYECGIAVDGYREIAEGDIIEVYEVKEIQRSIG